MPEEFLHWLFAGLPRQSPGSRACTRRAFACIPDDLDQPLILDAGCGSGSSAIELAGLAGGKIIAVDISRHMVRQLCLRARKVGVSDRITPVIGTMEALPFNDGVFDIIWSEGAIYCIGFLRGLRLLQPCLKDGGYLVVSELAWVSDSPPAAARDFFAPKYPGMVHDSENRRIIEDSGYQLVDSFAIPRSAWWDEFYVPLKERIRVIRTGHEQDPRALEILDLTEREIAMFERFGDCYSYIFYIMRNGGSTDQGCFHPVFRSPV